MRKRSGTRVRLTGFYGGWKKPDLRTVAELQELARNAPHVTQEWVLEVASMDPMETAAADSKQRLARKLCAQSRRHPEFRNIGGGGIDGCRSHKEVRAILDLLRQIDRLKTPND